MRKFLVARFHYSGLFSLNWKAEVFQDLLDIEKSAGFIYALWYSWSFKDIKEEEIDGKKYISGLIVKINEKEESITIDERTKSEVSEILENTKEKEGLFFIEIDTHLIAIEVSKKLTRKQFQAVLIGGYSKAQKYSSPEFDFTYDEEKLMERVLWMKKVKTASFKLKTTNPSAHDEFKVLDDNFRMSWVSQSNHYFKGWDSGLNVSDTSSIVRQAIAMSASWYWSGTIWWEWNDWTPQTVQMGDNVIDKIEVLEEEDDTSIKRKLVIKFQKKKNG